MVANESYGPSYAVRELRRLLSFVIIKEEGEIAGLRMDCLRGYSASLSVP